MPTPTLTERLESRQIEHEPPGEGDCDLCGAECVTTVDLSQNVNRVAGPGPWACLDCCQRVHETLTAALDEGTD